MVAVVRPAPVKRGTPTQRYWHATTKRCDVPRRDLEQIAFRLGVRVDSLRRAIEMGLFT